RRAGAQAVDRAMALRQGRCRSGGRDDEGGAVATELLSRIGKRGKGQTVSPDTRLAGRTRRTHQSSPAPGTGRFKCLTLEPSYEAGAICARPGVAHECAGPERKELAQK